MSRISGPGEPLFVPSASSSQIIDDEEEEQADDESEHSEDEWVDVPDDNQVIPDPDDSDVESGREDEYEPDEVVVRLVIKLILILIFKEKN